LKLSEAKVVEAQEKADQLTLDVEDLEAAELPETFLLHTVSGEQDKDRTDRSVVTPWLKLLWEAYRNALDVLKNNTRLEEVYQVVCHQTFQFCLKYQRKVEFRRLCELLRSHLHNFSKYAHQAHSVNLNDPESLQRQLTTRFEQLNISTELELWQEAFHSIEDIHSLLTHTKKVPKAQIMADYYSKLVTILKVSENHLFHAAALNRYFTVMNQQASTASAEKKQAIAEKALLATLAVPVITPSSERILLGEHDEFKSNQIRLTNLLNLTRLPTRSTLIKDLLNHGVLSSVSPSLKNLYHFLETEFHPLSICKKLAPVLAELEKNPTSAHYVAPLRQVVLTRLLQQLSQVYTTIKIDSIVKLASFAPYFEYDTVAIEKFIMNGCKRGELTIHIDHATSTITFDTDLFSTQRASSVAEGPKLQQTPAELMKSQLSNLAKRLYCAINIMDPSIRETKLKSKEEAFAATLAAAKEEHKQTLARKALIERRKEIAEILQQHREKEEARERAIQLARAQEAERIRVAEETKRREEERKRKELEAIQREEALKLAESMKGKIDADILNMENLDTAKVMQLQLEALEREKNEMANKLKAINRHVDHLERAFRKEEIPLLEKDYENQQKEDITNYEATHKALITQTKAKHEEDMTFKKRFNRVLPFYNQYLDRLNQARNSQFEEKRAELEAQKDAEKNAIIEEFRSYRAKVEADEAEVQRIREEKERLERERKEEEERIRAEKAAIEAEKKAEEAERLRKLDEQAAKQRERERLAEEKIAASKSSESRTSTGGSGAWRPSRASAQKEPEASPSAPAKTPVAPGGWRARMAAKEAEKNAPEPAPEQPSTPQRNASYSAFGGRTKRA
jgi:translation initiation factor 3 subunit A